MRREGQKVVDRIVDVVIYASCITIIVWGILKGIGVINTPALVEQLPLISGGITLLGLAYKIGRATERIEQRFVQHEMKFDHLDKDLEFLKQRV